MPSYESQLQEAVFQSIIPQLQAQGFSVFVHPSKDMLPDFLNNFRPDAIAYKGDRKIAIEIMSQSQSDGQKIQRIRQIFSNHPDWEFRLVYAPPRDVEEVMPALSKTIIEENLQRIENSFEGIGGAAALLIAWAIFEAAARRLVPASFARPQSPSRLIEVLASEGDITPDEADILRRLSRIRNEIAHGRLDLGASREQVEGLATITRAILELGK